MTKYIAKIMQKGSKMQKFVTMMGVIVAVSLIAYILYSLMFVAVTVLGGASILITITIAFLFVLYCVLKHPEKKEYSEFTKKYL